jgi:hypothetical protein
VWAEVNVLVDHNLLDALAVRIENAYRLRRRDWNAGCSTGRVWSAAALRLVEVQQEVPWLPLDPELFVAAQPLKQPFVNPWCALTEVRAARRYRKRVQQIVAGLAAELRSEVARAERRIKQGESIDHVLAPGGLSLSPLGGFIVACRAERWDIARQLLPSAVSQHNACPLYRQASRRLLPPESYPGGRPRLFRAPCSAGLDAHSLALLN